MKAPKVVAAFQNMTAISFDQVKAKAENDERYRLRESDFKGMRGYERYHLDPTTGEERPGEAPDGSYKWRWRPGRGDAVAEAIMSWAMRDVARVAEQNGYPGSYGIKGRRTTFLGMGRPGTPRKAAQGRARVGPT